MSPGWISDSGTCGSDEYCSYAECGSETPARPHAHIVRPEQSNPTFGSAAPKTYCVPTTDAAAEIAIWAADAFAGGGGAVGTSAGGPLMPFCSSSAAWRAA